MWRGRYITNDPTILIRSNDHTSLEVRGMYITGDPTILLVTLCRRKEETRKKIEIQKKKKKKKNVEKREERGKGSEKTTYVFKYLLG